MCGVYVSLESHAGIPTFKGPQKTLFYRTTQHAHRKYTPALETPRINNSVDNTW